MVLLQFSCSQQSPSEPKSLGLQHLRRRRRGGGSSRRCHTGETSTLATGPQAKSAQGKTRDPRDGHDGPQPMPALMTPSWLCQLPMPHLLAPPRSSVNIENILETSGNQGFAYMPSLSQSCRNPAGADHSLYAMLLAATSSQAVTLPLMALKHPPATRSAPGRATVPTPRAPRERHNRSNFFGGEPGLRPWRERTPAPTPARARSGSR